MCCCKSMLQWCCKCVAILLYKCELIIQHLCCNSAVNMLQFCNQCTVIIQHMCCSCAVNMLWMYTTHTILNVPVPLSQCCFCNCLVLSGIVYVLPWQSIQSSTPKSQFLYVYCQLSLSQGKSKPNPYTPPIWKKNFFADLDELEPSKKK